LTAVPLEQNASLTELARHQPELAETIVAVRARLAKLPRDPSIHAAGHVLATRASELADVREAMGEVLVLLLRHPNAIDFDFDAVLTDYLDGMRRWTTRIGEALAFLADELARFDIDWTEARRMLDLVKAERPAASMASVRAHLVMLQDPAARHELTAAFEEIFFASRILETNLEQRFG
jgi:hypothetical protein